MSVKINKGIALESLSITPLIDVVFLLLIFFLVATRFADEEREIDLKVPQASEAQPLIVAPKDLFINIKRDGSYWVNGALVSEDQLDEILELTQRRDPDKKVIIRSDKHSKLMYTVAAVNLCDRHRLHHVLATEK